MCGLVAVNLYPYQETGRDFLAANARAYLGDKMGLGKTVQAIMAAREVDPRHVTVVCPASAVPNWFVEIEMWDEPSARSWHVVSYSSLIRRTWKTWFPELTILDEAHYAKGTSSRRTLAALGLAKMSRRAWLLSGTPMPNNPTELWPPIKALWPHLAAEHGITTAAHWRDHFTRWRPTEYGPRPYAVKNGAQLRAMLDGIMLRRHLEEVGIELPPLRVDLFRLPKDRAAGEALAEYEDAEADETVYTSTLRRLLGTMKAPLIAQQLVEELEAGAYEKIVVLYYHRDTGEALRRAFGNAGFTVAGFDGSTPQRDRKVQIDAFQTQPDVRVFLAQQTAAGIAINLHAASEIVLVEPAWSPDDNAQAIARIHRIGQDQPCRARIFTIAGTLDERIMTTVTRKVKMQTEVGL